MLLVHTSGSTKIGDVRRYTITYSPSKDPLLPLPTALHLRIKNTNALPFRAAYLNGPYTLYVSVRRQEYTPWPESPSTTPTASPTGISSDKPQNADVNRDGGNPMSALPRRPLVGT